MKRFGLFLLTCLTVLALLLPCALAEAVSGDVDPVISEEAEFLLGEDWIGSADGSDAQAEGEAAVAAPEAMPMAADSEFVIEDGVLVKYNGPGGDVVIPSGVTSIGASAFFTEEGDSPLTSVVIPEGVTSIGDYAFEENYPSLKRVTFPSTLVSIGYDAFRQCEKLENFTLPNSLRTIGSGAFMFCDSLTSVTIPEGVTTIDGSAFFECLNLTEVTVAGSVKKLVWNEFANCPKLRKATLLEGVTTLGTEVFENCDSLETIVIPTSVTSIDKTALSHFDSNTSDYTPLAMTISTSCGSFAQKWAADNGYKCEISSHNAVIDAAVVPTCTTDGLTEGSHCSTCNTVLVAQQVIPATGHTAVTDLAVAPAYGVPGKTEGSHCSVCGAVLVAQQEIPALTYRVIQLPNQKNNGVITVNVGEQYQLVPTFATSAGVTVTSHKSSKTKVATVDANGLITANAEGKAKITVKTSSKKVKATITIKVVDPYKPTGVSIAQGKTITVNKGEPLQLSAVLAPATAQSGLTWKSSKKKVATVDTNGLVTPKAEGKAKITVTTRNKKKAKITIKVVEPYKPSGIAIAQGKAVTLHVGETLQLNATLAPATAQSALTWKSSKKKIATVDGSGLVTALKKGKAKITVRTYNKKKATITVNVVP